ncbi:MAG: MBG domain-containing protein [Vicinamibacterales bacterium]
MTLDPVFPVGTTTLSNAAVYTTPDVPACTAGCTTPPVTTTVTAEPNVTVTKSVSAASALPGGSLVYTIDYANTGNADAANFAISDVLPARTTFASATGGGTNAGNTVTWSLGTLAAGASSSVTVTVTLDAVFPAGTTTLSNVAVYATPDVPACTSGCTTPPVTTTVMAAPVLTVTKSVSAATALPGGSLVYTIGYSNTGDADATNVSLSDVLPARTTFASLTGPGAHAAGTVTWNIGTVAVGDSGSVSVTVTLDAAFPNGTTTLSNAAVYTTPDVPACTTSCTTPPVTTTVTAAPDLHITKSVSPMGPVVPGATLTYTIGYENTGNATANSVAITDLVPANTTFVSADNGGVNTAGTVTWSIASINAGATGSVTLVVTVNENTPLGTTISNSATIAGPGVPPVPPTPPVETPVAQPRLTITKSVSPAGPVAPGATLTYTIGYENTGNATANSVAITDLVPANTTFVSADNGGVNTAGTVTWSIASINAGATGSVTLVVTVNENTPLGTTISNSATIAGPGVPPVPPTPPVETPVAEPRLTITKSVDKATALPGETLVYTIGYENTGNADATGATISDVVPAMTSFAVASNGGTNNAGTVTWNLGTVAAGASGSVTLTVTLDTTFPIGTTPVTNSAVIAAPNAPPVPPTPPVTTTVTAAPVLEVSKSVSAATAAPGGTLVYTISYRNTGSAGATAVTLSDALPNLATFASATGGGSHAAGVVTWNLGMLAPGASSSVSVTVTLAPVFPVGTTSLSNVAVYTTPDVPACVSGCSTTPAVTTVKTAVVTAGGGTKTVGEADPALTSTTQVGFDAGDIAGITLDSTRAPGETVGSYATTATATGGNAAAYTITYVPGVFTITKATITVTANPKTVTYGDPDPVFDFAYGPFPGSGTPGDVDVPPTCSVSGAHTLVGDYAITCAGASDLDYDFIYVPGTLTVEPRPAQVIANSTSKVFGATVNFVGTEFTTTGFLGADTVTSATLTSAGAPAAASAAGSPYSIVPSAGVGTGLSNYTITYVNGVLTVTKATVTVDIPDVTVPYDGTPKGSVCTVSSGLPFTVSYLGTGATTYGPSATAPTNAGTYEVTCTFAGDDDHDGPVSDSATVTITKIPATVTAGSGTKLFGAADPALSVVVTTGFLPADLPSIVLAQSREAGEDVGSYETTATAAGGALDNYTVVYGHGNFEITPAPVVVTAAPKTITYGDPTPTFDFTYGAFPSGENPGTVTTAPTCSVSGPHSAAGTYSIVCTGANDDNLTFTYVPAPLVIEPKAATVTAGGGAKVYGTTDPALSATTQSGFLAGDIASITLNSTRAAGEAVGSYPTTATASGGNAGNYAITYVPGAFTITKASLTVKADDKSRLQGEANPALTATITGFVNGDPASVVSGSAALATTAVMASPTGAYPIAVTAGTLAAANYEFVFVNGTLTVLPNVTCSTTGYLTYSQGGWGNGGAPGQFLAAKFGMVYPTGYVIIGGVKTLKFTSANAIQAFLPQGGRPKALYSSAVDPTWSSAGNFAAQLLALRLAVDFSSAGATKTGLGDLVMVSGPLAGQTVNQILAMANTVLGGQTSALPSGMSISTLNGILESLNMNFHEGTVNNGLLGCPGDPAPCVAGTITLNGNSATSGTPGNIRSYSANGVNVKVSAFARAKSNGVWSSAFLGAWAPGVGVTDGSEGSGSGDTHMVDNIGDRNNYVLFEFDKPVVVTKAYLDYVGADSDSIIYVGTKPNAYIDHITLSDAVLASLSAEENAAGSGDTRWATFNGEQLAGNVLVIAALPTNNNDSFKVGKLQFSSCIETPTCSAGTFATTGNSATSGTAGNVRSFTANGVNVKASAFSRAKTSGVWSTAFLGAWSVGMGVTDGSEGDGSGDTHKVDNVGDRNNYVLFEFSQPVVVTKAYLSYIGADGDATVWIGMKSDPYNNHLTLSDALLASLGTKEDSPSSTTSAHWQPFNGGEVSGNVLVIAAQTTGTNDAFKIAKLEFTTCEGNEPPVNQPPVVSGPNRTNLEGDSVSVQVTGSDPNNDTITYSASGLPPGLSIDEETGAVTGDLSYTSAGTYHVTITVTDDGELTGTGTFVWVVTSQNRPPTVAAPDRSDAKGSWANVQVTGSDPDGDPIDYSATGLPPGTSMNTAGKITGTLTAAGDYTVTVTVKDPSNATGTGTFVWKVTSSNRAPYAKNDSLTTEKGDAKTIAVLANDTDPDGNPLTVTSVTQPSKGGVSINPNGTINYTPPGRFTGRTSFTYTISDGHGGVDTATVSVTVRNHRDDDDCNDDHDHDGKKDRRRRE